MTLSNFFLLVANHLWQSTLFALAAAFLVLALREAPARTRFAIWWRNPRRTDHLIPSGNKLTGSAFIQ